MSFPSVQEYLEEQGVNDPRQATEEQMHRALMKAFWHDLPDGMIYLQQMAQECKRLGRRILKIEDPNTSLGKQLTRLCGATIPRRHVQQEFGIALGFYNCCGPVAAPREDELNMSDLEQIMLQNGEMASADC